MPCLSGSRKGWERNRSSSGIERGGDNKCHKSQVVLFPYEFPFLKGFENCTSNAEAKCMEQQIILNEKSLLQACFKSKRATKYNGVKVLGHSDQNSYKAGIYFYFDHISSSITLQNERYIISTTDFIGSVGGSLGLFLGFSFFTYTSDVIEKVLNKFTKII